MKQLRWSLNSMVLASLFLSMACGGTEGGSQQRASDEESVQSESLTVRSADDPAEESPTAYHMPFLDDRFEEGENPELREGSEMYILVDSAQEGTPFQAHVNGLEEYYFKGRTPYYIDLDEYNEYGNIGAGSVTIYNGNTDDAFFHIELHTYTGAVRSDSCSSYECTVQVGWDGPD